MKLPCSTSSFDSWLDISWEFGAVGVNPNLIFLRVLWQTHVKCDFGLVYWTYSSSFVFVEAGEEKVVGSYLEDFFEKFLYCQSSELSGRGEGQGCFGNLVWCGSCYFGYSTRFASCKLITICFSDNWCCKGIVFHARSKISPIFFILFNNNCFK